MRYIVLKEMNMNKQNMTVDKATAWLKKALNSVVADQSVANFLRLYDEFVIIDGLFGHSKVTIACGNWTDLNSGRCCNFHSDLERLNRKLELIAENIEFVPKRKARLMSTSWIRQLKASQS